jgi:hypothetical protein
MSQNDPNNPYDTVPGYTSNDNGLAWSIGGTCSVHIGQLQFDKLVTTSAPGRGTITHPAYQHTHGDPSDDSIGRIAAHEFGHVLGMGDAYVWTTDTGYNVSPASFVPQGDLMQYMYSPVNGNPNLSPLSAWDIAMVMEAYRTNKFQYFMGYTDSHGNHQQSSIVGTYTCGPI